MGDVLARGERVKICKVGICEGWQEIAIQVNRFVGSQLQASVTQESITLLM